MLFSFTEENVQSTSLGNISVEWLKGVSQSLINVTDNVFYIFNSLLFSCISANYCKTI